MQEAKLTLGQAIDAVVEVLKQLDEKTRDTVLAAACSHLGIATSQGARSADATVVDAPPAADVRVNGVGNTDIRTLKAQKQPKSVQQMACLVAYYLQEVAPLPERRASVTTADLEKYFKQAGFKLPVKIRQVLIDGKMMGYFDSVGRGEYKLNAVGYNLVAHSMPSKSD